MAEGTKDAAILIATSWQALNRLHLGGDDTQICDSLVMILFAGFFIEANLNYIIQYTNMDEQYKTFVKKPYPGLQDKLCWFYNQYIAKEQVSTLVRFKYRNELTKRFPGYNMLYRIRNDLCHGVINENAKSMNEALNLRQLAKAIVDDLFETTLLAGSDIPRIITYSKAIENDYENVPQKGDNCLLSNSSS